MMHPGAESRVGSLLSERYRLVALLGQGGMGAVYRAQHVFTDAEVAVKVLNARTRMSTHARERFLREAKAPTAIDHPGVVKTIDAGVAEDGAIYLVLELLKGQALAGSELNAAEVLRVATDLLDCLDAAHQSGVLHRDIKPENIFLEDTRGQPPRVRLLDFGITTQLGESDDRLTQTGAVVGTPYFMSPEQARGQTADLYSVGATLFFALAGRPPFIGDNYNVLMAAVLTQSAPPLRSVRKEVSPSVAAIVDRALQPNPEARFQSAAEMRAALAQCIADIGPNSLAEMHPAQAAAPPGYPPLCEQRRELEPAVGR